MSNTIYVIRHADKPAQKDATPYGVKDTGIADYRSLIVQGWQRAGCWVSYFLPPSGSAFGSVTRENLYVYASARAEGDADDGPSDSIAATDGSKSRRPTETVTPLAAVLKPSATPDTTYTKGQEAEVAAAAAAQVLHNVVICWQHEAIPAIVDALIPNGIGGGEAWRSDCFNGVITLTRATGTDAWQFSQASPKLLHGDHDAPPIAES